MQGGLSVHFAHPDTYAGYPLKGVFVNSTRGPASAFFSVPASEGKNDLTLTLITDGSGGADPTTLQDGGEIYTVMGTVSATYSAHQIDFSAWADATPQNLLQWQEYARDVIHRYNACAIGLGAPFTLAGLGEEDFVVTALSRMHAARLGMKHCPFDHFLGIQLELVEQVKQGLLESKSRARAGTSDDPQTILGIDFCSRTGEH
jgi:hypothetical protein